MLKRAYKIQLKKGHKLFNYFESMSLNAKNLYNSTNFYIRQVYTALSKDKELQALQKEVLVILETNLPAMNEKQLLAHQNNLKKEAKKPVELQKTLKPNVFVMPTQEKSFVSYHFLDCLFKLIKQSDYLALPTQSSQATMRKVYDDWSSFFAGLAHYTINPLGFTGRPKIPSYQQGLKEVYFTNQDCVIKDETYLKFPKTKERLNIGKLGIKGHLKQVRVIPSFGMFVVELVLDVASSVKTVEFSQNKAMSIDLGVNNLAVAITNTGMIPCIFNGRPLKSVNQYYNKQKAHYCSILRHGKDPKEEGFLSKRLQTLDTIRFNKTMDYYHKVSRNLIRLAVKQQVQTLVLGKNNGWKQEIKMRKRDKQNFTFISHEALIKMIIYKAEEYGIKVMVREESYTSKASAIDKDIIPTYGDELIPKFSGRRITRGMYKSKHGIFINADVNGAYNILRKAFPDLEDGIEVSVCTPLTLSIS